MNEQNDFERLVADQLARAGVGMPPRSAVEDTIARAGGTRRLPEWLALIKEPPMRTNSHLAVGSPAVRVAAVLVATLLLAVSLAAGGAGAQQLLAAGGPIVVAQDGSGTYETIIEAVAAADEGDEILVEPGTYIGSVLIDKDITLRGDGTREEVILEFGEDGSTIPSWRGPAPYGLMLVDTTTIVSDLTVRGPNMGAAFVFVGGAPTLERVANELEGEFSGGPHTSVAVVHGAGGTIRESHLDGPTFDFSGQRIPEYEHVTGSGRFVAEDNVLDVGFGLDVTDGSAFLRNTVTGDGLIELVLVGGGEVLVAQNDVAMIEIGDDSEGVTIRDNVVGSGAGLSAISLGTGGSIVEGNVIRDARVGILVPEGGTPTITKNRLEGLKSAIGVIGAEAAPVIEGNHFCDNERNLVVQGAEVALDPSNEVCADTVTE